MTREDDKSSPDPISESTMILFQTVSTQIDTLSAKIDNLRIDIQTGALDYAELKGEVNVLKAELEENVKPRISKLEEDLENLEKEDKNNFKAQVGWIVGGIIGVIAILLELIRYAG